MCGIVGMVAVRDGTVRVTEALATLRHRGPDAQSTWASSSHPVALGHARLSIIDLSSAGTQPMTSGDGRYTIVFNGELYNYLELRRELSTYTFRTRTDTEVVLAAWSQWGASCLDRFLGMFAFLLWDAHEAQLYAVRDRFGVKPLYYAALPDGGLALASEIKALHAAGVARAHDIGAWAAFLAHGVTDQAPRTLWTGVHSIPPGTLLTIGPTGSLQSTRWYDLAARIGPDEDQRPIDVVSEEYMALLQDSVALRFRADVPVGINLSGGVDSSLLVGLVHSVQGPDSDVKAFTFTTGAEEYDELPWVRGMLERTEHPLIECRLEYSEVPALASAITAAEDEPFGGLPTLAYAKLFSVAREHGVTVLLDGQGLDEQWAGYDYYRSSATRAPMVQGASDPTTRTDCLSRELLDLAVPTPPQRPFTDQLRNLQFRDTTLTKLPRALRYNDRVSMAASTELREPFLDHRLFELAMRQPRERKIQGATGKWMLRAIATAYIPEHVRLAPKRALQTPQREWLRGPLRDWADALIERGLNAQPDWFNLKQARATWRAFQSGQGDNSYWVWQWLSLGLLG